MQLRFGNWLAIVVGVALLAGSALISPARTYAVRVNQVLFSAEEVAALSGGAAREMEGSSQADVQDRMVQALIDNELLYQYGAKMGLQNSDPIVHRRVVQLVLEMDATSVREPTESQLREYFDHNPMRYQTEAALQFLQLYQAGTVIDASVAEALRAVRNRADFENAQTAYGEPLRVHDMAQHYPLSQLASLYGPDFAQAISQAVPGQVRGPWASSLGLHWVWVVDHRAAVVPQFEAVSSQIERDWRQDARTAAHRRLLDTLRSQAVIDVRVPQ